MNPFTHCCLCILQPFLPDNSSFRIVVVTRPAPHFGWINSQRKQLMRLLAEPLLDHSWFSTAGPGRAELSQTNLKTCLEPQWLSFLLIISIVGFRNWTSIIPKTAAGRPYSIYATAGTMDSAWWYSSSQAGPDTDLPRNFGEENSNYQNSSLSLL